MKQRKEQRMGVRRKREKWFTNKADGREPSTWESCFEHAGLTKPLAASVSLLSVPISFVSAMARLGAAW